MAAFPIRDTLEASESDMTAIRMGLTPSFVGPSPNSAWFDRYGSEFEYLRRTTPILCIASDHVTGLGVPDMKSLSIQGLFPHLAAIFVEPGPGEPPNLDTFPSGRRSRVRLDGPVRIPGGYMCFTTSEAFAKRAIMPFVRYYNPGVNTRTFHCRRRYLRHF